MFTVINALLACIAYLLNIYMLILFIAAVMRLMKTPAQGPVVQFFYVMTDVPAQWLRARFPKLLVQQGEMNIDLSLFVLLLLTGCLQVFVGTIQSKL